MFQQSSDYQTYYDILGIGDNATSDEIKKNFFEKIKFCHPDKLVIEDMIDLVIEKGF